MGKKILIFIVLLFLMGTQFFLPPYTANQLKTALQEEVDDYQNLEIDVASFPAFKILFKAADKVQIRADKITIDQLRVTDLKAEFQHLQLEETKKKEQIVQGENTDLNLVITEADLNSYLRTQSELDIFKQLKLDITPQQVILKGIISVFNAEVTLQLTGDFTVLDDRRIIFNSDKLAVENYLISTNSIDQLKEKLQFELDLKKLPFPLDVKEVKLREDKLVIIGPTAENN